jgi:hypothetical protein
LGARPVPARGASERVGRKRRFADTGVASHTSRISIDSEVASCGSQHHSDKEKFCSDLNCPKNCKMSEWVLKTLRKFEDFQAEYEGSIPFTRSIIFRHFLHFGSLEQSVV